jgi:hypothetical protein
MKPDAFSYEKHVIMFIYTSKIKYTLRCKIKTVPLNLNFNGTIHLVTRNRQDIPPFSANPAETSRRVGEEPLLYVISFTPLHHLLLFHFL